MDDPEDVLSRPAPAPPRTLRYADGETGVIDVWDTDGARATVALVHGGFWKAEFDRIHLRPLANALASQGFSVASIEYPRVGMPGGGWPGTVDSVMDALRAVLADERLGAQPVVAVGHSAGGHLVALAGSAGGVDGLAGVVPLAGVLDLRLADELGLPVAVDARFGDDAWLSDMVGAQAAFTDVIAQGGTSVVCAQGEIIPGLIAWLSAQGTLPIDGEIHAKKGSVWVLSFHGGQLTGADYIPTALPVR